MSEDPIVRAVLDHGKGAVLIEGDDLSVKDIWAAARKRYGEEFESKSASVVVEFASGARFRPMRFVGNASDFRLDSLEMSEQARAECEAEAQKERRAQGEFTALELKGALVAHLVGKGNLQPKMEFDPIEHASRLDQVGVKEGDDLEQVARGFAACVRGEVPSELISREFAQL